VLGIEEEKMEGRDVNEWKEMEIGVGSGMQKAKITGSNRCGVWATAGTRPLGF
jgi:hypothetical protein